jgi:beta-lactamase superfamily II metal-dependent hydrolase
MARQARRGARLTRAAALALAIALAAVPGAFSRADGPTDTTRGGGDLGIRFFDVGQGDGVLITLPDGKVVLVDGGRPEGNAASQLHTLGIDRIDLLLASHADYDHAGVHELILRDFPVTTYLTNGLAHTSQSYARITSVASALVERGKLTVYRASSFEPGQDIGSGGIGLPVLAPPAGVGGDQNENSVGLVVSYGEFDALMTGDSDAGEISRWLLAPTVRALVGDVEVYKAAHHGSGNGGDADNPTWLKAVSPDVVVICVGPNNYGHPTAEALSAYAAAGAKVYSTDLDGLVTVTAKADGTYTVDTAGGRSVAVATVPAAAPTSAGSPTDVPAGGVRPASEYDCPASHPIKGNRGDDWIYHAPGTTYFSRTKPEECFATEADARAAGYRAPKR